VPGHDRDLRQFSLVAHGRRARNAEYFRLSASGTIAASSTDQPVRADPQRGSAEGLAAVRPVVEVGSSRRSLFCYNATELASPKLVCLGVRGRGVAWKPEAQERDTKQSGPGARSMPHGGRHLTVGGPEVAMNIEIE